MKRLLKVIGEPVGVFVLCLSLIGCAAIIHGRMQQVPVSSSPAGATVTVNGLQTTTPGVFTLERNRKEYTLVFEKEGYEPVQVKLERKVDGWIFGNIIYGGLIGLAIDFGTGSAYRLSPSAVNAVLSEKGASIKRLPGEDILVFVVLPIEER
jgi:hypothetical protein